MAYLVRKVIKGHGYLYVVKSERVGGRVRVRTLEYLGNADKVSPARLKRALAYWKVGTKRPGKGGRG